MNGKIFVISAPSGAGKTTLLKAILKSVPELQFSISATTRKPRKGEQQGKDYLFCSREEFLLMISQNKLAEWEEVHSNYYGSPKDPIDKAVKNGVPMVLDIDVFGKKKLDAVYPKNISILIVPPSLKVLEERLSGRGTDSRAVIQERLRNAKKEMTFAWKEGQYKYRITNDSFTKAKDELLGVFKKELG